MSLNSEHATPRFQGHLYLWLLLAYFFYIISNVESHT